MQNKYLIKKRLVVARNVKQHSLPPIYNVPLEQQGDVDLTMLPGNGI